MHNIRKDVIFFLKELQKNNGYSNLAVKSFIKNKNYTKEDKAFAAKLIYGVTERLITLDYYIGKLSQKPIQKLDPVILNTLRVSLYQICYMDKVPDSAAVNEAVKIIKSTKLRYASGFVNAVLRNFIRTPVVLPCDNYVKSLSIRYSCNENFISELIDYIGIDDAVMFLEDSFNAPKTYIRVNTLKCSKDRLMKALASEGVTAKKTLLDDALEISCNAAIDELESFKSGCFYVQDLASQISICSLNPIAGDRILDMCAAPGGKSMTAAISADDKAKIIACDVYESRVNLIKQNAERLCLKGIEERVCNAEEYNEDFGLFDKVICDVPCSGYGVIRRKPEIRYKDPSDLTNLPLMQYNMLSNAARYVKAGGIIIYSTCTLRREENEDIVSKFLNKNNGFHILENGSSDSIGRILLPQKDGSDGFFFALIKKG